MGRYDDKKSIHRFVLGALLLGSLLAGGGPSGCGCGEYNDDAYFTNEVWKVKGSSWVSLSTTIAARSFAEAIPLSANEFIVIGGYDAPQPFGQADDSFLVERCNLATGCVELTVLDHLEFDASEHRPVVGRGTALLSDGTAIGRGVVRPDSQREGGLHFERIAHSRIFQFGDRAIAIDMRNQMLRIEARNQQTVIVKKLDGLIPVAPYDDKQLFALRADGSGALVDVDTGETSAGPSIDRGLEFIPGESVHIGGGDALVFENGNLQRVLRFDMSLQTWSAVPQLTGSKWVVETELGDGALLSRGNPWAPMELFKSPSYEVFRFIVPPLPWSPL